MYKVRLQFSKQGGAAYISHLDLMKTLQRSFCRAKLPVRYSKDLIRISISRFWYRCPPDTRASVNCATLI